MEAQETDGFRKAGFYLDRATVEIIERTKREHSVSKSSVIAVMARTFAALSAGRQRRLMRAQGATLRRRIDRIDQASAAD